MCPTNLIVQVCVHHLLAQNLHSATTANTQELLISTPLWKERDA